MGGMKGSCRSTSGDSREARASKAVRERVFVTGKCFAHLCIRGWRALPRRTAPFVFWLAAFSPGEDLPLVLDHVLLAQLRLVLLLLLLTALLGSSGGRLARGSRGGRARRRRGGIRDRGLHRLGRLLQRVGRLLFDQDSETFATVVCKLEGLVFSHDRNGKKSGTDAASERMSSSLL
jgi:hypothetical protein